MAIASQLVFKKVVWALRIFDVKSLIHGEVFATRIYHRAHLLNKTKTKVREVKWLSWICSLCVFFNPQPWVCFIDF